MIAISYYNSPVGEIILGAYGGRLVMSDWRLSSKSDESLRQLEKLLRCRATFGSDALLDNAAGELDEYFGGNRRQFDIPLRFFGTPWQTTVWNLLQTIPYGSTASYRSLAAMAGRDSAWRAAANACAANRLSIFLPCHRVLGTGSPGGYRGGADAKKRLLEMEINGAGLPEPFSPMV